MLAVSASVERARLEHHPRTPEAERHLHQGQCNCAYWHGLFGGLYVPHLRSAAMSALLAAEELVADPGPSRLSVLDHDGDGHDDLVFEASTLRAFVAPHRGGLVYELDHRPARFCPSLVLGRRREAYHEDVAHAGLVDEEELGTISAHDLVRATEPGLAEPAAPREPGATATHADVLRVRLACDELAVLLTIEATPACTLWRRPIETVSGSERGFEARYQGTCLVFVWPLMLSGGMPLEVALSLGTEDSP